MPKLTNEQMASLYAQHRDKTYAVALYALKNPHDAEDVVQDAFLSAFQNVDRLREADKFEPWLMRIVANRAKDVLKKKKPDLFSAYEDPETGEAEAVSSVPDGAPDADVQKTVEDAERRRILLDMLDSLREDEKLCVLMFYEERMRIAEIAETLGVQEYTVKNYLAAAKKKLRRQVEEKEKQGYTLRGFSGPAIALTLRWLFSTSEGRASLFAGEAAAAAGTAAVAGAAGTAAVSAGAAAAGTASAAAGTAVAAGGLAAKIVAVVAAVALLAAGGVIIGKKTAEKKREESAVTTSRAAVAETPDPADKTPGPADGTRNDTDEAPAPQNLEATDAELAVFGPEYYMEYSLFDILDIAMLEYNGGPRVRFPLQSASGETDPNAAAVMVKACAGMMYRKAFGFEAVGQVEDASGVWERYSVDNMLGLISRVFGVSLTPEDLVFDDPAGTALRPGRTRTRVTGDALDVCYVAEGLGPERIIYGQAENIERGPDGVYTVTVGYTVYTGADYDRTEHPSAGTLRAVLREEDGVRYWRILDYRAG